MLTIDFTDKTAVVTGGARGLGREIALQLAQCGANVWIADLLENEMRETVAEIKKMGRKASYSATDVSDIEQVKKLMNDAEGALGHIDILVHAAAILIPGPLMDARQKNVEAIIDINVLGTCNVIKSGLEAMIPNKAGKIVCIASVAGRSGFRVQGHYNCTKAAQINFVQSAAIEGGAHGINVNTVCPGIIRTKMWDQILEEAEQRTGISQQEEWDGYMKSIAQRRPQTEEEIANATLFLCSDLASAITGQALNVDGGNHFN